MTPEVPGISSSARLSVPAVCAILVGWLGLVVLFSAHHLPFRDEVKALSVAVDPPSLPELLQAVHPEGHPLLWYLILRLLHAILPTVAVLKVGAVSVATAAICVFLISAPFHRLVKIAFAFGQLALFEYSVMARNYGISMLLMFAFAALYGRRERHPLLLGAVLFLLANTNVHSALLVPLLSFVWLVDRIIDRLHGRQLCSDGWFTGALALAALGVVACGLTVWPQPEDLIVRPTLEHPVRAGIMAILDPATNFQHLFPGPQLERLGLPHAETGILLSAVVWLFVLGLAIRPNLLVAGLAGTWGISLFFTFVYGGGIRHEGIWFVFMVSLYWIALAGGSQGIAWPYRWPRGWAAPLLRAGPALVLSLVLLSQLAVGIDTILRQVWLQPYTMAGAAARTIRDTPELQGAVLIAEPDYMLESLPYYVDNPTYLLREAKFGKVVTFTRRAQLDLSLDEILVQARRLHAETGRPVLLLLEHPLKPDAGEVVIRESYGWTFRYDAGQVRRFRADMQPIASLRGALTENYDLYRLK
jgi:hypothetical protein